MQLMSRERYDYSAHESQTSEQEKLRLLFLSGGKGVFNRALVKTLDPDSSQVGSRAAISKGRVSNPDTISALDVQTTNLGGMNTFSTFARCGSSKGIDLEIFCLSGKGPASIKSDEVSPTDSKFGQGVDDDHPFVDKNDLGTYQEEVQDNCSENRFKRSGNFYSSTCLVKIGPSEQSRYEEAQDGEVEIGSWAKDLSISHTSILSHFSSYTVKAVR